jgi:ABC-type transport system involved in multi-copper enzyme maturation permease subunit
MSAVSLGFDVPRTAAVVRKELADFRRSRFIVATMGIFPLIFLTVPTVTILARRVPVASPALTKELGISLLYLLLIPVVIPSVTAAYAVAGEREQGTLEPVLTTPVRREELLIGKALAIFLPAAGVAYVVFGLFLGLVRLAASPAVASTVFAAPELPAEAVFIPLLAAWSIWVGLALSARVGDIRAAQQLSIVSSLPPLALAGLMSFNVIHPTFVFIVLVAGGLLVIDGGAYLLVSRLFDRERLITGLGREGT